MNPSTIWPFLFRILGIIAILFLGAIGAKLVAAMLSPVLPPALIQVFGAGWGLLTAITGPSLPAVAAIVILGALLWIFIGKR